MPEISVHVKDLTRLFGRFIAVDHVSFDVLDGEIFGFLGANGAGKTTTIRMLCGLLLPSSGHATIEGFDIYKETYQIKQTIGYMSQKFSLYDDLTVEDNLLFYGGVYGLEGAVLQTARENAVETFALQSFLKKLTRELPLGWKQRLALACSLLHRPKILFLDEPTGGVDPISRRQFWQKIYELAQSGTTIFVTTHYMDEAEYCHRISIMHQGKIVALDAPEQLKRQFGKSTVQDVFIHLVARQGEQR